MTGISPSAWAIHYVLRRGGRERLPFSLRPGLLITANMHVTSDLPAPERRNGSCFNRYWYLSMSAVKKDPLVGKRFARICHPRPDRQGRDGQGL